jgi:hypothetical protein
MYGPVCSPVRILYPCVRGVWDPNTQTEPRRRHDPIFSPRVDHIAHWSRPERQRCSWGACRESEDGRAAAQPPYACTDPYGESPMATLLLRSSRSSKVPQAASSLAMPPEQPAVRQNKQRKTGSYTALLVVTSWPPCPRRHSVEPPLPAPSAAMLSAHYAEHDSESRQPDTGAWSAAPSGLRSAPWNHCRWVPLQMGAAGARESQEVREGFDGWRRPHPEQPFGGPDGCRTRQHGGSGLKRSRPRDRRDMMLRRLFGGSLAWVAQGSAGGVGATSKTK